MSQNVNHSTDLQGQTKQLLDGPLKHIRAAALAAALVPLASVFAAPAAAQSTCAQSGGACVVTGTVFNDTNQNGYQDAGEPGIEGVKVYICQICDGSDTVPTETGPGGTYS